ncbi:GNAT family N-acetyltransferase [Geodermatophilus sp. DSM 44513]|uniref:GNAT family N-acetyltransferase n=1 Tax=Geodermatophilus sp. DSM 44513 TaxID=1528104 RepID=UPI001AA12EB5|nr:GNAT family N-acetyltransferase [Geodermatophilus sp. DSM 44513]WNV73840.1 GNAT family N-acetyltransferase [Geodermatophilus sp. DSM 44513]
MTVRDPGVLDLVDALTAELAEGGYTAEETFGYTPEQLERSAVHLVGARVGGELVGIGGLELQDAGTAELKRFYVRPAHRGTGVADALLGALLDHAARSRVGVVRLETGDAQHAALAFYRRHGFTEVPRFGPYVASATSVCLQRTL